MKKKTRFIVSFIIVFVIAGVFLAIRFSIGELAEQILDMIFYGIAGWQIGTWLADWTDKGV